jgi:hypothetical protein
MMPILISGKPIRLEKRHQLLKRTWIPASFRYSVAEFSDCFFRQFKRQQDRLKLTALDDVKVHADGA